MEREYSWRKRKKEKLNKNILKGKVKRLSKKGWGIVEDENGMIFNVHYVDEGEEIIFRMRDERNGEIFGEPLETIKRSPSRIEPKCRYYGVCGGCNLMHLSYERQIKWKLKTLVEALSNSGFKTEVDGIYYGNEFFYRTKARLKMDEKTKDVGFVMKGENKVLKIDECYLFSKKINDFLKIFNNILKKPFSHEIFVFYNFSDSKTYVHFSKNVEIGDVSKFFGKDYVFSSGKKETEFEIKILNYSYRVSPSSFFQSNMFLIDRMLQEFSNLLPQGSNGLKALDLFSGSGFFSAVLIDKGYDVYAVESSKKALKFLKKSFPEVKIVGNDAYNIKIFKGYRIIVSDPPRSGLGEKLIKNIRSAEPGIFIYVSCNPESFERDLRILKSEGFFLDKVLFFDMFPHTPYYEVVAKFVKAKLP